MRNLIFFILLFPLCMINVLSLADESIDDDQRSRASADKAIIPSPSFPFRLPSRWLNSHRHHAEHHGRRRRHEPRHKHHGGHHNPPTHDHGKWPPPVEPLPPPSDNHQTPPPTPKKDPQDCSTALIYEDGCVPDLISSYFGENVKVSANCCHTIAGLSGKCFDEAFAQFETPAFNGRVKGFCDQLQSKS